MLTDKEKKKRQHKKELKSFRNKMVNNLIWFDSLSEVKKYDLLFEWKRKKYSSKLDKPKVSFIKKKILIGGVGKPMSFEWRTVKVLHLPEKIKHFLKESKKRSRFKVGVSDYRNTLIDIVIKSNIKN